MTKQRLKELVDVALAEHKNDLQLIYDSLNPGQQKQLLKKAEVRELLNRYNVDLHLITLGVPADD